MASSLANGGSPRNGAAKQAAHKMNLAARAGRWSAQHRKTAIWGWLGFMLLAVAIGSGVGIKTLDSAHSGVGESGRAELAADDGFPKYAEEMVLVQSRTLTANDVDFQAVVADAEGRLKGVPHTQKFESPYSAGNQGQISKDGHSALLRYRSPAPRIRSKIASVQRLRRYAPYRPPTPGSPLASSAMQASRSSSTRRSATTSARRWSPPSRSPS